MKTIKQKTLDDHLTISTIFKLLNNLTQSMKNTPKFDYPTSNLLNTRRCGAKTRKGTACKGAAVRGKRRCRMHGGTNPGRPRDPFVQELKYYRMVSIFIGRKNCFKCKQMNADCAKIHGGQDLPEEFERRIQKYCHALNHHLTGRLQQVDITTSEGHF